MKQNRNVSYLNQNKTKLNYVIKFSLIKCSLFITITKLAVALVWSVRLECTVPLGTGIFRNFKQEFLLNGKHVECLRKKVGSARRLNLPLQKGDWRRWVTVLAEPTFRNLKGSPCFEKKCVKRCLFQRSSGSVAGDPSARNKFFSFKRGLNF